MHIVNRYIAPQLFAVMLYLSGVLSQEDPDPPFIYKSYQNLIHCPASSPIQYPTNVTQLQQIIRSAVKSNQTVKVIGSRHSITVVICTSGIPVRLQRIQYMSYNVTSETVTVASGVELEILLDFLQRNNRSLVQVPAFGGITIGGAMGTGAHGSSLRHPTSLSDQVVSVTIIDGMGNLQRIEDEQELRAFRVHLGLLGAIVDVTLKTVPFFKITIHNYLQPESVLLDGTALEMARNRDWFQLWWFPSSQDVVFSEGNYSDSNSKGNAKTNLISDQTPDQIQEGREALEMGQATKNLQLLRRVEQSSKDSLHLPVSGKQPIFTEWDEENGTFVFVNPATGWAYQMMSNKCTNKCAWDNGDNQSMYIEETSVAVDVNLLPQIVQKIKEILTVFPAAFPLLGIFLRFHKQSEAFMSIASDRDVVTVELATASRNDPYENSRYNLAAYQAITQALVHEFDGRPHWGKNGLAYFTRNVIERMNLENLDRFRETMRRYDPNGRFLNRFGNRVLGELDLITVPVEVHRCAIQDFCICEQDADCTNEQNCSLVLNKYTVCKDSDISEPPGSSTEIQGNDDDRCLILV